MAVRLPACLVATIFLLSTLMGITFARAQNLPTQNVIVPDVVTAQVADEGIDGEAERAAARAAYDALILRAREGNVTPVLEFLRGLGAAATASQRFDHILVASWAGQTNEVISLYDALPSTLKQTAPVDVQIAVARSLRDLKNWSRSLDAWRTGLAQHPEAEVRFIPGLIMTLADSGQMEEAVRTGQAWNVRSPNNREIQSAIAYVDAVQARLQAEAEERAAQAERERYDALIVAARAGNIAPALNFLRGLGGKATPSQRFDHILVASWAEIYDEVARSYQALSPEMKQAAPAEVSQVVARALRNLKQVPQSLALSRAGMAQYPQQAIGFVPVLVMDLADSGQLDEAIKIGLEYLSQAPQDADLHMALAYVYTLQEKHFEALFHADKAYAIAPQRTWIEDEYIRILNRSGMSEQALDKARQAGQRRFSGAALRVLEADEAARRTRLAAMPTRSEAERFVIADRALARYDELLGSWRALGVEAASDVIRIRIDRLAAYHARVRMEDLVREYEALLREGVTIPVWALSNVASAYLYLRQPEKARDLYRDVLADLDARTPAADREKLGPKNARLANEIGLMYALSEAEQFGEMKPILKKIEAYSPVFLYHKGSALPDGNTEYLSSRQALIAADLAMDDTPAAQRKLEELVREAPNNTDLLTDMASVYRVRARPRMAEQYYKLAETLEPRDSDIEIGQGLVALDLQEWRQVEELTQDVINRFPESRTAQRLARLWQVHNMAEFRISTSHALGTRFNKNDITDTTVSDSGDFGLDAVLYSRPMQYNWRAFIGGSHAQGKFSEGKGHYSTLRTGLEWRSRDVWLEGEIHAGRYGQGTKVGARLSGSYDIDDHWQVGGSLEYLSRATPVRALRAGIRSNVAEVNVRWRGNERREWSLSGAATHFSDGNDRWAVDLAGVERLYTTPNLALDMLLSASTQHNSDDDDRPYFNPKQDLMLLPALRTTHRIYRRYENVWEHFLTLSAGKYNQKDYGTSGVWGAAYGHRYRHNDVFEIGVTLDALSRTYDGRREGRLSLLLDMMARF